MAQLVFAEAGRRIGSAVLPNGISFPGGSVSGAKLGSALGSYAGRAIDNALAGPIGEPGRLDGITLMESREGAGIPRVFGRYRIGGQLLWASHVHERKRDRQIGGKGGPRISEYSYTISFAVGLCAGEVSGLDRVWANGEALSLEALTWRLYPGSEDQLSDPVIEALEGSAPAFRGLAYIVFEDFPLDDFGARLPQLSFEVSRSPANAQNSLRDIVTGVNFIPASGEWVYSPELIRRTEYPGWEETLNRHAGSGEIDVIRALDQLQADLPNVRSVNLTLAWFGNDLHCGNCQVRPGVETRDQINLPRDWKAGGQTRANAHLISRDPEDRPYYGGTPDDRSVLALLDEMASRGLSVTISPFLLMDIPPGNALPDPYGGTEQAAFPWRGRITAPSDGTAAVRADIESFFGVASASDFSLDGLNIVYSGPSDWGYNRFVLHLAMLANAAGKTDKFLLGSELRGLTRLRDETGAFPAVEALIALAAEVRNILGPGIEISYAADWTEYGAYVPGEGLGDVFFPLDPLWTDANIDFIGLDWYAPLSDWRDGEHLDRNIYPDIYDPAYLAANIEGGEGYDWYYASEADRIAQTRTPIADTAHNEDWVFRVKAIRDWWQSAHYERPAGVRAAIPTSWLPQSKPVRLIEIGCGAIDKGSNTPNVFVDPKSAESGLPAFSDGSRDDAIQASAIQALYDYWAPAGDHNPVSDVYAGPMIPADGLSVWCYDARPFPAFPTRGDIWSDGENWQTGHWLNGRLSASSLSDIVRETCLSAGIAVDVSALRGHVPGYAFSGLTSLRQALEPLGFAFSMICTSDETGLVFASEDQKPAFPLDPASLLSPIKSQRDLTEHAPKAVSLTFPDPENAYLPASVRVGIPVTGDRDLQVSLPISMPGAAAERLADTLFERINAQKLSFQADISPGVIHISAGDLVLLPGEDEPFRVSALERAGSVRFSLVPVEPVFTGSDTPVRQSPPPVHTPRPDFVVLDLPNLPGAEEDIRPLVGAFAMPWPGGVQLSAGPDATGLSTRAELSQPAMIGRLVTALPGGPGDRIRPGSSVRIRIPAGEFASHSRIDMLNGANLIAIETSKGWMLAGFETADMLASDEWRLSGLLTGLYGTEELSALGAQAGTRIVMLDGAMVRADLAPHELGASLLWRSSGADPAEATLILAGRAKTPLRPGHFRAARQANGDIALVWTRRARHSADRLDMPDVPLLEEALSFRLSVYAGEVLLRTEWVAANSWIYSAAAQAQDEAPFSGLTFGLAQVSAAYGEGVETSLTLL